MLIPRRLASRWRGTTGPSTGEYRALDIDHPVTDYDRACAVAWPGRSLLQFMEAQALVLYTEFDAHTWDSARQIVACGGWLPSDEELRRASWTDPIAWRIEESDLLLMNSAADGTQGFLGDDFMALQLAAGNYTVEYSYIEAEYVGYFHRFVRRTVAA